MNAILASNLTTLSYVVLGLVALVALALIVCVAICLRDYRE